MTLKRPSKTPIICSRDNCIYCLMAGDKDDLLTEFLNVFDSTKTPPINAEQRLIDEGFQAFQKLRVFALFAPSLTESVRLFFL